MRPSASSFALLSLFFFAVSVNAFGAEATVLRWNAAVSDTPGGKTVTNLPAGVLVNEEKREKGYTHFSYRGFHGWTRTDNLKPYPGHLDDTREKTILAQGIRQEGGKWYLYYWQDGKIRKYNVEDRFPEAAQKCEGISEIRLTPKADLLLLEGITTNGGATHHLAAFQFPSGKVTLFGSFPEDDSPIDGTEFSKNGAYLAVTYRADGVPSVSVYRTDSGELIGGAKNVNGIVWSSQTLVLFDRNRIWAAGVGDTGSYQDYGYRKESFLTNIKSDWTENGELQINGYDEEIAIAAANSGVFRLNLSTRQVQRTQFRGLVASDDGALNFVSRGDYQSLRETRNDRAIAEYSGSDPRSEFLRFCGTNFLAKKKFDKIESLCLMNSKNEEIYRYRAIDHPGAVSAHGILAELETDKDLSLIAIEDPWKGQFHVILEKTGK